MRLVPPSLASSLLIIAVGCGGAASPSADTFVVQSAVSYPVPAEYQIVPIPPDSIPDPKWVPKVGDAAVLFRDDLHKVILARDMTAFAQMVKFMNSDNRQGLAEMGGRGELGLTPVGTAVQITGEHENPLIADGVPTFVVDVRNGEHRGRTYFVPKEWVVRMIRRQ